MNEFDNECLLKIYEIFNSLDIYAGRFEISGDFKNPAFEFDALINQKHFLIKVYFQNSDLKIIDIEYRNKRISKSNLLNNNYQDFFNVNDLKKTAFEIKDDFEIKKLSNAELAGLLKNIFFEQLKTKYIQDIPCIRTLLPLDMPPEELLKKIIDICVNPSYAYINDERVKPIIKKFLSLFIFKKHTNEFIEDFFKHISKKFANKYSGMEEKERFELLVVKLSSIMKHSIIKNYDKKNKRKDNESKTKR